MYMNDRARSARNAYRRQWARGNKDKIRAQQERYWEKKAAEIDSQKANDQPAEKANS